MHLITLTTIVVLFQESAAHRRQSHERQASGERRRHVG